VTKKRTRLHRLHRIAGVGAFTVAGVLGLPAAAMASPGSGSNPPPVVTDQAAASAAASMLGSLGQPGAAGASASGTAGGSSGAGTADTSADPGTAAATDGTGTAGGSSGAGTDDSGGTGTPSGSGAMPGLMGSMTQPAAPTDAQLHPLRVTAAQQTFTPTATQLSNAKSIVDAGKAMGLPPRAWVIAVATSIQESNLRNLGHLGAANDHDSLGLFQQRPSSGWGTAAQVQDPTYAATAFYKALVRVPGWDTLPLTTAAQKVQVSAYPSAYAKHESEAGSIIDALYGVGPYADLAAGMRY